MFVDTDKCNYILVAEGKDCVGRQDKLLLRLGSRPADFTWDELVTTLRHCGYEALKGSGSRRKFYNAATGRVICLHEPHPGHILKAYQVREIIEHLKQNGYLP